MLVADHALAVDHEGLGHAGRADQELHPAYVVLADAAERVAVLREEAFESSVRSRTAMPTSGAPRRSSAASCGASAAHGTHQLAKMLTRCGWPSARSALARPGRPGTAAASANCGHGLADHRALDIVVFRPRQLQANSPSKATNATSTHRLQRTPVTAPSPRAGRQSCGPHATPDVDRNAAEQGEEAAEARSARRRARSR